MYVYCVGLCVLKLVDLCVIYFKLMLSRASSYGSDKFGGNVHGYQTDRSCFRRILSYIKDTLWTVKFVIPPLMMLSTVDSKSLGYIINYRPRQISPKLSDYCLTFDSGRESLKTYMTRTLCTNVRLKRNLSSLTIINESRIIIQ